MIQFLLVGITVVGSQHMTLCDYYEKLGVAKSECGHIIKPQHDLGFYNPNTFEAPNTFRFSSYNTNNNNNINPQFNVFRSFSNNLVGTLPLCRNYFHSCMSSTACESGVICTNGIEQGSCCTNPHRSNCPSATSMNINCRKTRSVNWCNSDVDCRGASTTASMCCPTGCNYNMCVHVGAQVYHPRRSIVFNSLSPVGTDSDQCPDPFQLDVKCVTTKGANWCYTDTDCRSGLYTRKCCATNCGYNTCVMKFNDKWIIA
ncbi:unnamed protein product [Caenorhabditis sp. 36 PRJEB53466]|nr:unnamed protein product [Caenorhabditis sp. 36 PRJEB53466]